MINSKIIPLNRNKNININKNINKNKKINKESIPPNSPQGELSHTDSINQITKNVTEYLNNKAGTKYKDSNTSTKTLIKARLKEGYTEKDIYTVIDKKVEEWKGTEFASNLKFTTLLSGKYFDDFLNQPVWDKNKALKTKDKDNGFMERDLDDKDMELFYI